MVQGSGSLIIVSGPSGAGKSALVASVLERLPSVRFSVSYTTRAPRGAERNGVEYFFVDRAEFRSLIQRDSLLEWAEMHGNFYGTSRPFVEDILKKGDDVLLDIDVQGAASSAKSERNLSAFSSCRLPIRSARAPFAPEPGRGLGNRAAAKESLPGNPPLQGIMII